MPWSALQWPCFVIGFHWFLISWQVCKGKPCSPFHCFLNMAHTHSSLAVYPSLGNQKIKWCLANCLFVSLPCSSNWGKKKKELMPSSGKCSGDIWFTLSPAEFSLECVCCKGILLYLNVHCLCQNTRTRSLRSLNDWMCVLCACAWVCVCGLDVCVLCTCVWVCGLDVCCIHVCVCGLDVCRVHVFGVCVCYGYIHRPINQDKLISSKPVLWV